MRLKKVVLSLTVAMLFSVMCAEYGIETLFAMILAVAVHELSHIVAIYVLGMKVKQISVELSGLKIEYSGTEKRGTELLVSLAGPIGGIVYYVLGSYKEWYLNFSAELSLLFSVFNLLPVLPLDGGRVFCCLAAEKNEECTVLSLSNYVSKVFSRGMFAAGLIWLLLGEGNALFAAGIWLMILQEEN